MGEGGGSQMHCRTLNQYSISVRNSRMGLLEPLSLKLDVWPWKFGVLFDTEMPYGLTHQARILPIDNSGTVKTNGWVSDGIWL